MNKYEATNKVRKKLFNSTHEEVSKIIGITRPTLNARLKFSNWKVSEIYLIEKKL